MAWGLLAQALHKFFYLKHLPIATGSLAYIFAAICLVPFYGYLAPVVGSPPVAPLQLEPALAWKARLAGVRNVSGGSSLGYSASYAAAKPMRVGVVSVGYGDGFDRRLSNGGAVLVRGRQCPVVGLVSMDVTLIDLSALPAAEIGDEVTLIGPSLDAQVMAGHCGTITYEVLSRISSRVPRVYRAP